VTRLSHGDLGTSLANRTPIAALIGERLMNTFTLAAIAALIAVPLSIAVGVLSVVVQGTLFDRAVGWLTLVFISLPDFVLGYGLILLFGVRLRWVPNLSNVYEGMEFRQRVLAMILPCATLVFIVSAHMIRMARASIVNVVAAAYIEMAHLKGLSQLRVIGKHALANAVAPIVTVVVLNMAYLVVGVVIVEVVFVYPGMGQLMVDSVAKRDIPVVQACALIFGATYITMNIIADVTALLCNPRIRHPR
jgi:peptide/nickel transport system permease protein